MGGKIRLIVCRIPWRPLTELARWRTRNGIGINEQANIELPGLKGLWSLRGSAEGPYDSYLVVSFISETKVLASAGTLGPPIEWHEPNLRASGSSICQHQDPPPTSSKRDPFPASTWRSRPCTAAMRCTVSCSK